jgi:hypothetical protein
MLFQLRFAPVAQMDRASASEAEGREFDPHRARHSKLPGPSSIVLSAVKVGAQI